MTKDQEKRLKAMYGISVSEPKNQFAWTKNGPVLASKLHTNSKRVKLNTD